MTEEVVKDKLQEIYELLATDELIKPIVSAGGLKSFQRDDSLSDDAPSITLIPVGSPEQVGRGSNKSLSKHFIYQINVETTDRLQTKQLQRRIEQLLETFGFYQVSGGLEEYFEEIKRYVDARRYEGNSKLYGNY